MSKYPVFVITRKTFDEKLNKIELYYVGKETTPPIQEYWTKKQADATHYLTHSNARTVLLNDILRHGNEHILQIETDFVKVI